MLAATPQKVDTKKEGVKARKKTENKYRNPKNHAEVWQGRGLKPKWMTREIEAVAENGITLTKEYFLIK
jgi:DNA-binding protein H-NS